jgi:hypothetical protein
MRSVPIPGVFRAVPEGFPDAIVFFDFLLFSVTSQVRFHHF